MKNLRHAFLLAFSLTFVFNLSQAISISNDNLSKWENAKIQMNPNQDLYPKISNKTYKVYNGDTIIQVTANGLPAIIARPNQDVNNLLAFVDLSKDKFAKYNDTSPVLLDDLVEGAVYYLKSKKGSAQVDYHIVKPKETLWDIAQIYGVKKKSLLSKNRMTPTENVVVGRKMYLKSKRSKSAPVEKVALTEKDMKSEEGPWDRFIEGKPPVKDNAKKSEELAKTKDGNINPNAKYHTVQEGETIFSIAKMYNVSALDLKNWNKLQSITLKKDDVLRVQPVDVASNQAGPNGNQPAYRIGPNGEVIPVNQPSNQNTNLPTDPESGIILPSSNVAGNNPNYGVPAGSQGTTNPQYQNLFSGNNPNYAAAGNATAQQNAQTHVVQRGESIYAIARNYGVSARDLIAWNRLSNSTYLEVGQQIYVSNPSGIIASNDNQYAQPAGYGQAVTSSSKTHTVAKGETLYKISRDYNIKVNDIRDWNNLVGDEISVGQVLVVGQGSPAGVNQAYANNSNNNAYGNPAYSTSVPTSNYNNSGNAFQPAAANYNEGATFLLPAGSNPNSNPQVATANPGTSYYNTPAGTQPNQNQVATQPQYHVVKNTDNIFALAAQYNVTVDELRKWNNIPFGTDIYTGQQLVVKPGSAPANNVANVPVQQPQYNQPAGYNNSYNQPANNNVPSYNSNPPVQNTQPKAQVKMASTKPKKTYQPKSNKVAQYHTVQSGETLYAIARKYGTNIDRLKRLNGSKADRMLIGTKLVVDYVDPSEVSAPTSSPNNNSVIVATPIQTSAPTSLPPNRLGTYKGINEAVSGDEYYTNPSFQAVPANSTSTINVQLTNNTPAPNTNTQPTYSAPATSKKVYHTVKKSETLYSIGRKYKVSVSQLKRLNSKTDDTISVGEKLRVK
ncbi:LysM peptidoglycan-binding domain-containing protein [Flexithrix dorotheae]|uniref:LysM peptidoglycan-binding domain-containing protein n=1 Tax=Flexithrix dorotheae TaxID=70993 RepID=UPI00035E4284|nr:LysM peptidoglycan-binding domain-containing protein [Flexithrix dorotheae]